MKGASIELGKRLFKKKPRGFLVRDRSFFFIFFPI